jgi:outer membrane protein assembly factor BamE (lipoprotein component of BamABCDE complex)
MPERPRRAAIAAIAALAAAALAGCDYIAQKKLIAGQHTEHDVRALMGVPTLVWDRADGGKDWDYVRAPQGIETIRVSIGSDGRYQSMTNLLTEANFAKARQGMTGEDLTRLLSRPTDVTKYPLKPEVVWSWRYEDHGRKQRFNVHFDPVSGRAARFSTTDDPQQATGG